MNQIVSDLKSAMGQGLPTSSPDPLVAGAFALGWQMAELYRPTGPVPAHSSLRDDLPGLGRLDESERAAMSQKQISAAFTQLSSAVRSAGLDMPDAEALSACFAAGVGTAARRQALRKLHGQLLVTLSAADPRLGKAYGLGRALADTCRNPVDGEMLLAEFRPHRIANLRSWLDDLSSALPPFAAVSVSLSLNRWVAYLGYPSIQPDSGNDSWVTRLWKWATGGFFHGASTPGNAAEPARPSGSLRQKISSVTAAVVGRQLTGTSGQPARTSDEPRRMVKPAENAAAGPAADRMMVNAENARPLLRRQGELWRALLADEKAGQDMLEVRNYLDAISRSLGTVRRVVFKFAIRFPLIVLLILGLFAGGVALMLDKRTSASIVAGAGGILASLGLTWKSVGGTLGGLGAKLEEQLWGSELTGAIADAITLLPGKQPERGGRRQIAAAQDPKTVPADPVLHPELLAPVLNPDALMTKIDSLIKARQDPQNSPPEDQRLPATHFDQLRGDILDEQDPANPARATTAKCPAAGRPAPPPVIYISRKPSVSQFQSVISHCVEQELSAPPLDRLFHLRHLTDLFHDIDGWTKDLRSRFRTYGPCDIRFIEPKLYQLLVDVRGWHQFSDHPAEAQLGSKAKVIVFGDWATALPQARNVAAQIRQQVALTPADIDCHVIHLGDTYYSGTEDECRRRFLDFWPVPTGSRARSWTISGNHDMYAGGYGYFDVLLRDLRFEGQNGCSYFALSNNDWQILGMDCAYDHPDNPDLYGNQSEWLQARIESHGADSTILLTHNQAYSPYESVVSALPNTVAGTLGGEKLGAWLWGHEHWCATYDGNVIDSQTDYEANARYAAVIGHGGVPDLVKDEEAGRDKDVIQWSLRDYYQVSDDLWGLGGFAVLSFNDSELRIQYYDEYGNVRRQGDARAYKAGEAAIGQILPANDPRPAMDPDVLRPGENPIFAEQGMAERDPNPHNSGRGDIHAA